MEAKKKKQCTIEKRNENDLADSGAALSDNVDSNAVETAEFSIGDAGDRKNECSKDELIAQVS